MYAPPFHRRILPWVYVAIFFALAPVLIFYTSGYRYNPNKTTIEHHGTLILDSTPRRATVSLDGTRLDALTPTTRTSITPGSHRILIARDGYHPWEKVLDVRAEYATFVDRVRLWKNERPSRVRTGAFNRVSTQDSGALLFFESHGTSTHVFAQNTATPTTIPVPAESIKRVQWSPNTTSAFIETNAGNGYWMRPGSTSIVPLPMGTYYWSNDGKLFGTSGRASIVFDPRQEGYSRETLPPRAESVDRTWFLETATSSPRQFLQSYDTDRKIFSLPEGRWMIADRKDPFLMLRDGMRWLGVRIDGGTAYAGELFGDYPRWLTRAQTPTALFIQGSEVWRWELGSTPTLLIRESAPLVDAVWHPSGDYLFLATERQIIALEHDDRGGRHQVMLADFDSITGLTYSDGSLSIAGTREQSTGIWRLEIE